ncbi:amidase domain-containing protein [Tissierella praeacuta]|uniref:amidase domain-containing protein n=1 Tax=Tissierella praeacuta TaxID=43131 RepID=UPI00333F4E5E
MIFTSTYNALAVKIDTLDEDKEFIKDTIQKYFESYYETLKTGAYIDVANLFIDNEEAIIPQRILKNNLLLFKEFGRNYTFYELKIDFKDIEVNKDIARAEVIENAEFHYNTVPEDIISRIGNVQYVIELKKIDGNWKMSSIDSENNLDYEFVREQLKEYNNQISRQSKKQYIENVFDEKDSYTKTLKNSLEKSLGTTPIIEINDEDINTDDIILQGTYSYNIDRGIRYARKYAYASKLSNSEKIFADCDPDCTNFVSQCIWAAYGGWDESSVTNSRNNVHNKVRMTSEWYGSKWGYGAFSNAWAGVPYLYNYVTKSKATGPNGYGYGEASPRNFDLARVGRGDVIQLYNSSWGNWRHSLYVSYAYGKDPNDPIVLVCAHSGEARDEDIIKYLNKPNNTKVRGLYFSSGNFDK